MTTFSYFGHFSLVPSMWFWSVSWSTNCSVYFSFFLVDQKKFCPVSDLFCSLSWIYCPVFFKKWEIDRTIGRPTDWPKPHFQKRLDKKFKRLNKKDLILDKFFFGRPKKMRNRPDNWSTKRLTKTTWTGLQFGQMSFWSWPNHYGQVQINLVWPKPFWTDQNCFGHIEGQGISLISSMATEIRCFLR